MILEVLYSNVANLYGDLYNVNFLKETLQDELEVIYTEFYDEPYFVNHHVDMVYMGSMIEKYQKIVIENLKPYKKKLEQMINENIVFLITGNAMEIFGQKIDQMEALGIFNYFTESDYSHHHNSCFLGKLNDQYITGFKSCFSYTSNCKEPLFEKVKGYGFKDDNNHEGVKRNNFFATYLIGPVLIQNPYFTHLILKLLNVDRELKNEQFILDAYNYRIDEYLTYSDFKEFKH